MHTIPEFVWTLMGRTLEREKKEAWEGERKGDTENAGRVRREPKPTWPDTPPV